MEPVKWKIITGLVFIIIQMVIATHFRSAIIMVRPSNSEFEREMEVSFRISWRRASFEGSDCDDEMIKFGNLSNGNLNWLACEKGCRRYLEYISDMRYVCTDYSITDNWSFGEREVKRNFSESGDMAILVFSGGGYWIAPIDYVWHIQTSVNMSKRNDTGKINSTPRAVMVPITKIKEGCIHTIIIPVSDPDNDIVRCRWAKGPKECGSVCDMFPNATLKGNSCTITYEANFGLGIRVAALMIEDFLPFSVTPMSSVSLHFTVDVYSTNDTCSARPKFIPPTIKPGACVAIPPNKTYTSQLIAESGQPGQNITEIKTVSPLGLTKSPIFHDQGSAAFSVNISWKPKTEQHNRVHAFCFTAVNSLGESSEQSCIQYMVGSYPPSIIRVTVNEKPHGKYEFQVLFDKQISLTGKEAKLYFRDYDSNVELFCINVPDTNETIITDSDKLTVIPNVVFPQNKKIYVELERDVVKGTEGCNPGNEPVTDKDVWTFITKDVMPPRAVLLNPPSKTNETAVFKWDIDEPAKSLCSIDSEKLIDCSHGTFKAEKLREGDHVLLIMHTDLNNNTANTTHKFKVDLTAPSVVLISTPGTVTNMKNFTFTFSCDEPENDCIYFCKYHTRSVNISNYTECPGNSYPTPAFNNEENYFLVVYAVDSVDNTGKPSTYSWTVDFTAPSITPIKSDLQCLDKHTSDTTNVAVQDNLDPSPKLTFLDKSNSCTIIRIWSATDEAGNLAQLEQEITPIFTPSVSIIPSLSFSCMSSLQAADIPNDTATFPNPCRRPLEISFADSIGTLKCPGIFNRTWSVRDNCTGQHDEAQQTIILYNICPPKACGQNYSQPHGLCFQGKCMCNKPWHGESCEILMQEPKIAPVKPNPILEYQDIEINFTISEGTEPVTWNLVSDSGKSLIESSTGRLYLHKAKAGNLKFTVRAMNQAGQDEVTVNVNVRSTYSAFLSPLPKRTVGNIGEITLKGSVTHHKESPVQELLNGSVPIIVDLYHIKTNTYHSLNGFTDGNSQFSLIYYFGSSEYGKYQASARHPSESLQKPQIQWTVLGMRTLERAIYLAGETNGSFQRLFSNVTLLFNDGPEDLHMIKVKPILQALLAARINVSITLGENKDTIEKFEKGRTAGINIHVQASGALQAKFSVVLETVEGVSCSFKTELNIIQHLPDFATDPSTIKASITKGSQKIIDLRVKNIGNTAAENVSILLPESNVLTFSSIGLTSESGNGFTLQSQEEVPVSILITIPLELPLGTISGYFYIKSSQAYTDIPFEITVTSSNIMNLTIIVEDEYTYFADEKPLVSNANITLINYRRNVSITRSSSENKGKATFFNLPEDRYEMHVEAPDHQEVKNVIVTSLSDPKLIVFLSMQAITLKWSVIPTEVADKYDITLEADFRVNVPMPVVTIMPNVINLEDFMSDEADDIILFNVTNHGLIRADNVKLQLPEPDSNFHFGMLKDVPQSLAAKESVIIPVRVSQNRRKKRLIFPCNWAISAILFYEYVCGSLQLRTSVIIFRLSGEGCGHLNLISGLLVPGHININIFEMKTINFCDECLQAILKLTLEAIQKFGGKNVGFNISKRRSRSPDSTVTGEIESALPILTSRGIMQLPKLLSHLKSKKGWLDLVPEVFDVLIACRKHILNLMDRYPEYEKAINYFESAAPIFYTRRYFKAAFNDDIWFNGNHFEWSEKVLLPAFEDSSDLGNLISAKEIQAIKDSQHPSDIGWNATEQLLNRFNTTLSSWRRGILEPSNENKDIISYSLLNGILHNITVYNEKAKQRGFSSFMEAYEFDYNAIHSSEIEDHEGDGVCAIVRIQINQKATLTREGFIATLEIENKGKELMENIKVEINIYDAKTSELSTERFAIGTPSISGFVGGVFGNGTLAPDASGVSKWLIIPYSEAALTTDSVLYRIGGRFLYSTANNKVVIPFHPATIEVHPDPSLVIHYFWEKYVISDDPFTQEVEPAVPFSLGVMIKNEGYGTAYQMKISSAQPKIIENEKGLLITFEIIEASIGNRTASPSLTLDFEDIPSNVTKTARWWMTSSLIGEFISYNATFENTNPLGDPKLTLIDNLTVHELIQNVRIPGDLDDDILDFLANDRKDASSVPDKLYNSLDMSYEPVFKGNITKIQQNLSDQTLQLQLTAEVVEGWNFLTIVSEIFDNMPVGKSVRLSRAGNDLSRSNSTSLPCENAWLSVDVRRSRRKRRLHILDYNDGSISQTYFLELCRHCPTSFEKCFEISVPNIGKDSNSSVHGDAPCSETQQPTSRTTTKPSQPDVGTTTMRTPSSLYKALTMTMMFMVLRYLIKQILQ